MSRTLDDLTPAGKQELAMALLLLKDFKCDGRFDLNVTKQILELADVLQVKAEFEELMAKLPLMKISQR